MKGLGSSRQGSDFYHAEISWAANTATIPLLYAVLPKKRGKGPFKFGDYNFKVLCAQGNVTYCCVGPTKHLGG